MVDQSPGAEGEMPKLERQALPKTKKAWGLEDPDELDLLDKPVPTPGRAEASVRIDAVAICATDLEVISYGASALIQGSRSFNKNWTPGHECMGAIAALGPGIDEFEIGEGSPCQWVHTQWPLSRICYQQHQCDDKSAL
ncbi:MAG: alcohol dehydrogenase catalytic domain-containing protein [Roseobacter sp.]